MTRSNDNGAGARFAVAYLAKSSVDEHDSIGGQQTAIDERASGLGREVVDRYSEIASGYRSDRGPKLDAAIAHAIALAEEHGEAELWVWHSSRLARGSGRKDEARSIVEVLAYLRRRGVTGRSVQDDDFIRNPMLWGFASEQANKYSEDMSGWTKAGKRRRFESGDSTGRVHDGYRLVPRLDANGEPVVHSKTRVAVYDRVPDPERAPIIVRIFALFDDGSGPGDIARTLNAEGLRTRNGKHWTARRIRSTVADVYYAGWVGTGGGRDKPHTERHEGNHEAIVDRALFERVQSKIKRMDRTAVEARKGGRRPGDDYLLRKVATCGHCGAAIYTRRFAAGRFYLALSASMWSVSR